MSRSRRRGSRFLAYLLVPALAVGVFAAVRHATRTENGSLPPMMAIEQTPQPPAEVKPPTAVQSASPILTTTTPTIGSRSAAAAPAPAAAPRLETPPAVVHFASTGAPLDDARKLVDLGDLPSARRTLNDAMLNGRLAGDDAASARQLLEQINRQLIFEPRNFKDDPAAVAYTVQPGELLTKIAARHDVTWELLCRINSIPDPRRLRALQTIKIVKGPFHAVVNKKTFTMDIYLGAPGGAGSIFVRSFPVGLGKDGSTPEGLWLVQPHSKLKNPTYHSPRGEGIFAADDPKNPLGEFWIGLSGIDGEAQGKSSYGIHGTIEPDSIGREASMGCIRLKPDDIALVYELLVEGKSKVLVKD